MEAATDCIGQPVCSNCHSSSASQTAVRHVVTSTTIIVVDELSSRVQVSRDLEPRDILQPEVAARGYLAS